MEIGKRLQSFLNSKNKSGTQLAKDLNVSQTAIKRTIDGTTQPSSKILIPLIKYYPNLNIYWLLLGEGEMLRDRDSPSHSPQLEQSNCKECKEKDLLIASLRGQVEVLKELVYNSQNG